MSRILYLDQNKWIELARVYHGRDKREEQRELLDQLMARVRDGSLVVPLSAVHYMELYRVRPDERRSRLGAFMWELSRGVAISTSEPLVLHELEQALVPFFPLVRPRPFSLLGFGVHFAFGLPNRPYKAPASAVARNPHRNWVAIEARLTRFIERAMLTEASAKGGAQIPNVDRTHGKNFKAYLDSLPNRLAPLAADKREDALFALALLDIRQPLELAFSRNGVDFQQLASLGKAALSAFVSSMPSRRIDMHLQRQYLRNPGLRTQVNDLEDWASLAPAVMYCDAVVCEKHFVDLVRRDKFRTRAEVFVSLGRVREWLARTDGPA